MKNIFSTISVLLGIFISGQTGIATNSPTKTLDVNGELRIRSLPSPAGSSNMVTTDASGNLYKTPNIHFSPGDIKYSLYASDHEGWYKLDGRAISSLPPIARNNAVSLGLTTNLHNPAGRHIKTKKTAESVASTGGSDNIVLSINSIPSYSVSATLSSAGKHSHTWTDRFTANPGRGTTAASGADYLHSNTEQTITTSPAGGHTHTVTNIIGSATPTPISITPKYMAVHTYIYLGL